MYVYPIIVTEQAWPVTHIYYSHVKAFSVAAVPVVGFVALVDPPPGFVVAFVVGFVVGVVGRPKIVLNTIMIF